MSRKSRQRSAKHSSVDSSAESSVENLHDLLGHPLQLMSMFLRVGQKLGMQEHWLTASDDGTHAVLMLTLGEPNEKSRLVIAGIHGDEPAGVIGLLSYLFRMLEHPGWRLQAGSFAVIPMLSPSGFELQSRLNLWDEDPNRGFPVSGVPASALEQGRPSLEGRVLSQNIEIVACWARKVVLALHEDSDQDAFYLYAFNAGESAIPYATRLRDTGRKLFGVVSDSDDFEGSKVRDGIILNHILHGALDELLYKKFGVPVVVTETPGQRRLCERAEGTVQLLKTFFSGG